MRNIVITDKHHGFTQAIATGLEGYKAYKQFIAKGKVKDATARSAASKLLAYPEIQELLEVKRKQRITAIEQANNNVIKKAAQEAVESLSPDFFGIALTTDNLDQLHYNIVKGLVEVEEIFPVKKITKQGGKVVEETVSFERIMRKPTIRERQASIDALYKRFGSYAPVKGAFGFGKLDNENEGEDNAKRFVVLSDGTKIPF